MARADDLDRFYELLDDLEATIGNKQRLAECSGHMDWPDQGLYFFFTPNEQRDTSEHQRVTRVGTHAVAEGSSATLWSRLKAHHGTNHSQTYGKNGGNHRGSVFRLRVGEAILEQEDLDSQYPNWGEGTSAGQETRQQEHDLEQRVSSYIRDLPFLWVAVPDEPAPDNDRAYIEQNAIALLSNAQKPSIDARNDYWLGTHSPNPAIRSSGLWNINHVNDDYDPAFLDHLEDYIRQMDG
jgi:hypothetical protein